MHWRYLALGIYQVTAGCLGALGGCAMLITGHQPLWYYPPWLAFLLAAFALFGLPQSVRRFLKPRTPRPALRAAAFVFRQPR